MFFRPLKYIRFLIIYLITLIIKEGIHIPKGKKPYKRGYDHSKERGREATVRCSLCGTKVPRWKCITRRRGFRITDPLLRKELDRQNIHTIQQKQYVCPKCARFHNVVRRSSR